MPFGHRTHIIQTQPEALDGMQVSRRDAVEFKIAYLQKVKELLHANATAQSFVEAMKKAYPGLPGEAGLTDLGNALYR